MTTSSTTKMDLERLERTAQETAGKQIASLLQNPEQLEKVDQHRRRIGRKKNSVEAMLKTAVQSQLDGVRTGLNQLQNAFTDVKEIKDSLIEIGERYKTVEGLKDRLRKVRDENSRHSQLAAAVENLKHIFTVPESVKKTRDFIGDGKLLHAHKCLTDLERSRDDLLFELHKQQTQSPTDKVTISHYFAEVEKLSDELSSQLKLILQRTTATVRREPTVIVMVLRIVEREERNDAAMLRRAEEEHTGKFLPPGRPKKWRQMAFSVLEDAVQNKVVGSQMVDRESDKMWLVKHLEIVRQLVIEDLRVVKTLCEPCFPPHYDIFNRYVRMYHNAISQHFIDLTREGLEGNEIVTLLTWVHGYSTKDMMGHPELGIDTSELGPLLENDAINQLQTQYLQTMKGNFQEWMSNTLRSDIKDWYRETEPDADEKGYFNTALPVIMFQMIEQNLQVAATINDSLVTEVVNLCVDELAAFAKTYKAEMQHYKEKHLEDRSQPRFFLNYMIANVNNCKTFVEFTHQIKNKYSADEEPVDPDNPFAEDRFTVVADTYHKIADVGCGCLLEEVFLDLNVHFQEILTKKWLQTTNAVDTICITVEDYCQDFLHLKDIYYKTLLNKAQDRILETYLRALFGKKLTFKNYDERKDCGEKICFEANQLQELFGKLGLKPTSTKFESPFEILPRLAEFIKLRDTSMMSLEVSGFATKYPDVKVEHLVNLLSLRGDISKSEAKQLVIESVPEDDGRPRPKGILSNINVS